MSNVDFCDRLLGAVADEVGGLGFSRLAKYRAVLGRVGDVFHMLRIYPNTAKDAKLVASIWHPCLLRKHSFSDSISLNTCGGEISPWGFKGSWYWNEDDLPDLPESLRLIALPWLSSISTFGQYQRAVGDDHAWIRKETGKSAVDVPKQFQSLGVIKYPKVHSAVGRKEFADRLEQWVASDLPELGFSLEVTDDQCRLVRRRGVFVDVVDLRLNGNDVLVTPYVSVWHWSLQAESLVGTSGFSALYNINGGTLGEHGIGKGVCALPADISECFGIIGSRIESVAEPFFRACASQEDFVRIMHAHYQSLFVPRLQGME